MITREKWGASPRATTAPTNITPKHGGVAIHWVGGKTGATERDDCTRVCHARMRQIQRQHIHTNGWVDIAYTLAVCPHGEIFEGRGIGRRTAANGTSKGNQNWYAVLALVGQGDELGTQLLVGLRTAVRYLREHGAGPGITGHRDHYNTECPGAELYRWLKADMPVGKLDPPPVDKMPTYPGILKEGAKGTHVRIWQTRLTRLGYPLASDGIYGPKTKAATARFQERRKLPATGAVNAPTWRAAWS